MSTSDEGARPGWPVLHFAQSNPRGPGQGDVVALLRRVAESIEALGQVNVLDITFTSIPGSPEDDVTMTVYYRLSEDG